MKEGSSGEYVIIFIVMIFSLIGCGRSTKSSRSKMEEVPVISKNASKTEQDLVVLHPEFVIDSRKAKLDKIKEKLAF